MLFRERRSLAGLTGLLALGVMALGANPSLAVTALLANEPAHPVIHKAFGAAPPLRPDDPFGKDIKSFVASVREAEKLTDPLQRCLAYPDPPGSHWTHEAVVAYCRYRFQPIMSYAEVKDLIEHGKTAELDRRLDEALTAQLTQPDARGRLDQTFALDFNNGSLELRGLLDAWKRESPHSAYAYAASGFAYVDMAGEERGTACVQDTPQEKLDAMHRLLQRADSDLQQAIHLNPRIVPVYRAMIHAGGLALGKDYAIRAVHQASDIDPANWSIYEELMWISMPQWYGSLDTMQSVADSAVQQAKKNPLLWMQKLAVARYELALNNCRCSPQRQLAALDELAPISQLTVAGRKGAHEGMSTIAVVYLSEAMRFQLETDSLRQQRAPELAMVGESQMALDEANQLIKASPDVADNYMARGEVYEAMGGDIGRVERDFETALAMAPDDYGLEVKVGNLYINVTQEWDKAWDIADRILSKYPYNRGAWVWRAMIQEEEPRPGLQDTYQFFLVHFNGDPSMKWQIDHMREVLAKTSKASAMAVPETH